MDVKGISPVARARVYVCGCVRACVRACERASVCAYMRVYACMCIAGAYVRMYLFRYKKGYPERTYVRIPV